MTKKLFAAGMLLLGGCDDALVVHPGEVDTQAPDQLSETRASLNTTAGKLAFRRRPEAAPTSPGDIWMMNVDGSSPTQVTCTAADEQAAAWSPDGKEIIYYRLISPGLQGLYLIDASNIPSTCINRGGVLLTDGRFADWSRDGRLVFDRGTPGVRAIHVRDRHTEDVVDDDDVETNLTPEADLPIVRETRADWSPDGQKLVFARGPAGQENNEDIWVMNADGSGRTQLTCDSAGVLAGTTPVNEPCDNPPAGDNGPRWSPDGKLIVFDSDRDTPNCTRPAGQGIQCNNKVYLMNPDGTGRRRLLTDEQHEGDESSPKWSPDGRQIVFDGFDVESQNSKLFIVNVDGTDLRALAAPGFADFFPDWGVGRVVPAAP